MTDDDMLAGLSDLNHEPDVLADILQFANRIAESAPQIRSPYESPDEPRDTKMAAQLMATFKAAEPTAKGVPSNWDHAIALTGMPVEDVARQVNLDWLALITEQVQTSQRNDPRFGTPDDWVIVCSGHLFEHWTAIEGIAILHNAVLPPWSVYLVRSAAWYQRQLASQLPIRLPQPGDELAVLLPFPTKPPVQEGP